MSKKRSYDASNIIVLPRLSANSGTVLGQQLLTRANLRLAELEGLPEDIVEARNYLEASVADLHAAQVPFAPEQTEEGRVADQAENSAWRATEGWLGGFAELYRGGATQYEDANALYTVLFSEGLAFTTIAYLEQWQETQKRLDAIVLGGYEATIDRLGGTAFYDALKAAHTRYGEVLGITARVDQPVSQEVRAKLDAMLLDMKEYVLKVAAARRRNKPETDVLVDDLLSPLVNWSDPPTGSSSSGGTTENAAGSGGSEASGSTGAGTIGGSSQSGEGASSADIPS